MDRDPRFLLDMHMAAHRIMERTQGRTADNLSTDLTLQETVYWQLCVIGEAAGQLSDEFREANPEEPWSSIIGIRNRLIHG